MVKIFLYKENFYDVFSNIYQNCMSNQFEIRKSQCTHPNVKCVDIGSERVRSGAKEIT